MITPTWVLTYTQPVASSFYCISSIPPTLPPVKNDKTHKRHIILLLFLHHLIVCYWLLLYIKYSFMMRFQQTIKFKIDIIENSIFMRKYKIKTKLNGFIQLLQHSFAELRNLLFLKMMSNNQFAKLEKNSFSRK